MTYAVIDIGSNTIRMSVYDCKDGVLRSLINKKIPAGLASYVNESNRLTWAGIEKACSVLLSFREITENFGIGSVFAFATASLRNVENSEEAVRELQERTGFSIDLISGEQEAAFDFCGATYKSNLTNGMLVDIGGGSTELVSFNNGEIKAAFSFPIGSLNSYNRFVTGLFPTDEEMKAIDAAVVAHLEKAQGFSREHCSEICGVGGSTRGMFKLYNDLFCFREVQERMSVNGLKALIRALRADEKDMQKQILKTVPDRVHTIMPGMTILRAVASFFDAETVMVSSYGAREGYLLNKLELHRRDGSK